MQRSNKSASWSVSAAKERLYETKQRHQKESLNCMKNENNIEMFENVDQVTSSAISF